MSEIQILNPANATYLGPLSTMPLTALLGLSFYVPRRAVMIGEWK